MAAMEMRGRRIKRVRVETMRADISEPAWGVRRVVFAAERSSGV